MINVSDLKVGDRVGVGGGFNQTFSIKTVARRTASQAVLDDGSRWTGRGKKVGSAGYYREFLVTEQEANERNEETRKRAERMALVRSVRDYQFGNVSDDGLRMILALAKEHRS